MIDSIGLIAGFLTAGSFLPQLVKVYRTKSVKDFSWLYLIFLQLGLGLWVFYGFLVGSLPIIVANLITLSFTVGISFIKIKYITT